MFWTMNDMPTAVISGASRGACRSGLYAMRSIEALNSANPVMITTSVTSRPPMITSTLAVDVEAEDADDDGAGDEARTRAKTSPCAKLISCRMP